MSASFIKSITDLAELPEGKKPHIALVGRSNVGKSSLVNRLTNVKGLARVSASAGHTQTINFYDVDGRYFLVDLPGYGFAKYAKSRQAKFADMINGYLETAPNLALVLLLIDARLGPTEADLKMENALAEVKIPAVMVLTKIDKLTREQATQLVRKLTAEHPNIKIITHSTTSSVGRGEILDEVEKAIRAR